MKNLKRVLSLGLASVMLLGMMVVGASAADFTDSADIEHSEAVDVLVALGVVNGMEDGSYFDPKGDVTRAQMAKMIAVIKMGGTTVNAGVKTTPTFTDIKGHWAEAEIEYCADMGIISGRGDGTFDPDGKVTTTEVTKMVLTTLGYDAEAYQLTGASWAAQTDELARGANPRLYEDLSNNVIGNLPATRDTAAQLLWNGLQNKTRSIDPSTSKSTGEVTWAYQESEKTLIEERFDAQIMTGRYVGNHNFSEGDISVDEGKIAIAVPAPTSTDPDAEKVYSSIPSDLSIDNIGEEIKVVWKDDTSKGTKGQPDDKDTIFAVFNTGATKVLRSQLSKVSDNKTKDKQIKVDGSKYSVADEVTVITNYADEATFTGVGDGTKTAGKLTVGGSSDDDGANSGLTVFLKHNSGNPFKATFNDDDKIDKIYVTKSYIAAVTAVNSTSVVLNNGSNTVKFEKGDVEEGLEKGDVVAVTPLYKDDNKFTIVAKAEVVSGEVEAFKDQESITVNGKTYKLNYKNGKEDTTKNGEVDAKNGLLKDIPEVDNSDVISTLDNDIIEKDVDLYLVNGYVLAIVKTSESASNYSVILEVKGGGTAGSLFDGLQLQVMGADGTKEILTVAEKGSDGTKTDDYKVGDIITYTYNDDDEAKVKIVSKDAESLKYNDNTKSVNGDPTTSDCVLFVQTKGNLTYGKTVIAGAEYEVYDIRSLNGDTFTDKNITIAKKDDKVVAAFVNLGEDPVGAESNTIYGIISAYNGSVKDYYKYTVQCNGEEYDILTEDGPDQGLKTGKLVSFKRTANDKYDKDKVEVIDNMVKDGEKIFEFGFVNEYSNRDKTLSYFTELDPDDEKSTKDTPVYKGKESAKKTYALADDVIIVYVDQDGDKSEGEGSINSFDPMSKDKYNVAVKLKKDEDDYFITVLFVETSGEKAINKY